MNAAESSLDVGTTLDDSLSEELEKEVQETRKMVSALQVCEKSYYKSAPPAGGFHL